MGYPLETVRRAVKVLGVTTRYPHQTPARRYEWALPDHSAGATG